MELVASAKGLLMIARRKTTLPADAPPAYAKSQLGANALAYMKARGWLDGPRVQRLAEQRKEGR